MKKITKKKILKKKIKIKKCCNTELPDIKCTNRNKKFKLPRKYTKDNCLEKLSIIKNKKTKRYNKKKIKNICSPYINC